MLSLNSIHNSFLIDFLKPFNYTLSDRLQNCGLRSTVYDNKHTFCCTKFYETYLRSREVTSTGLQPTASDVFGGLAQCAFAFDPLSAVSLCLATS